MATAYPFEVTSVPAPEWPDVAEKALEDISAHLHEEKPEENSTKEASAAKRRF